METTENQTTKTSREQLLDLMKNRYPDRNFNSENGEEGGYSVEMLEQAVLDAIRELTESETTARTKTEKINQLFFSDPLSYEFVDRWMETGDPRASFVETFGDDVATLGTEEGRAQFSGQLDSWRKRKEENDRLNVEADANWNQTLEDLETYRTEKGLSTDEAVQILIRLIGIAANGTVNKYTADDFEMVRKEMTYDSAVNEARHAGEVAGRNAHIDENKKRRQAVGSMPPSISGGGVRMPEPKVDDEDKPFWHGIE